MFGLAPPLDITGAVAVTEGTSPLATVVNGVLTSEILRIAELLVVTIAKGRVDVLNPDPLAGTQDADVFK
jgi:hypothetical protein